jgi:hypothetical protein
MIRLLLYCCKLDRLAIFQEKKIWFLRQIKILTILIAVSADLVESTATNANLGLKIKKIYCETKFLMKNIYVFFISIEFIFISERFELKIDLKNSSLISLSPLINNEFDW